MRPGLRALCAALLLGAASLAGCSLTEERTSREAHEEAFEKSFYDPAYEPIFSDPPYSFERFGRDTGQDTFGKNGMGGPDLYPGSPDDERLPGIEAPGLPPAGEPPDTGTRGSGLR